MTTQTTTVPTSALAAQDASQVAASAGALQRWTESPIWLSASRCRWQTRSATPRCSPDDKADDRGGVPVRRGDHAGGSWGSRFSYSKPAVLASSPEIAEVLIEEDPGDIVSSG